MRHSAPDYKSYGIIQTLKPLSYKSCYLELKPRLLDGECLVMAGMVLETRLMQKRVWASQTRASLYRLKVVNGGHRGEGVEMERMSGYCMVHWSSTDKNSDIAVVEICRDFTWLFKVACMVCDGWWTYIGVPGRAENVTRHGWSRVRRT